MIPQYFRRGEPIDSAKLNALVDGVLAARLQSGVGYTVANTSRGTSLNISLPSAGASTAVCPFQVSTANEGDNWKFTIAWGLIGGKLPTGMSPNNDPPLVMDWDDGWVVAVCTFVANDVVLDTVSFEVHEDIPVNTTDIAYYAIAYIDTDSSGDEPVQRIRNVCVTPNPSVCDLAMESA